jgi:hypothetical protein
MMREVDLDRIFHDRHTLHHDTPANLCKVTVI